MNPSLEKILNKSKNFGIVILENSVYHFSLIKVSEQVPEKYRPLLAVPFLPIAAYILADSISRIVENKPFYRYNFYNECEKTETNPTGSRSENILS